MSDTLPCINHEYIEDVNSLNKISSNSNHITLSEKNFSDSDTDDEIRFTKARPKFKCVTESDSDNDKENDLKNVNSVPSPQKFGSDDGSDEEVYSIKKKSRIKDISISDSESLSGNDSKEPKSKYDLTRIKVRNKKLHDKFKKLKHPKSTKSKENIDQPSPAESDGDVQNSSDGSVSYSKIKQKLKRNSSHSLTAICDPDTSEDESNGHFKMGKSKPKSIKVISPKPVRMSAKQAMENMQKIKSESNRMLREKEVSLPYHRPKALTLKDVMNRRKPALTSDGKTLPIKMNKDQLEQYALMLEERQKEMMELCKSDTDEDDQKYVEEELSINKSIDNDGNNESENTLNRETCDLSDANDKTYDNINMEHSMNNSTVEGQHIQEATVVGEMLLETNSDISKNDRINDENETEIIEKEEQTMEIAILHENPALPLNNCNTSIIYITDQEDQTKKNLLGNNKLHFNDLNQGSEQESQVISLHYDSDKPEVTDCREKICDLNREKIVSETNDKTEENNLADFTMTNDEVKRKLSSEFSDNDFTMEDLEDIIENAEGISNKPLMNIATTLEIKPILTGNPGMVIDLDNNRENTKKKLTGVEILKEWYKYFARLKSLEDMEKDREKKFKPGIQHLKLKQRLEEQIAEQRSMEWEKRLQIENQLKAEINAVEGEEFDGDDIEKIEAQLEEKDVVSEVEDSSSEEEIDDADDYDVKDKPRVRNPLIDDEAEVSEDEDGDIKVGDVDCIKKYTYDNGKDENKEDEDNESDNDDEEDNDEESSESEQEEQQTNCRKSRILKAFEDSDDENLKTDIVLDTASVFKTHEIRESQDDEIHLAQPQKNNSDDLFSSQKYTHKTSNRTDEPKVADNSLEDLATQTFSILKSGTENIADVKDVTSVKLDVICETQPSSDDNFDAIIGMCTGGFSQSLVTPPAECSQLSQSQEIGDDVAELCTGKFYDNPFVSQTDGEVECNVENKTEGESMTESRPEQQTDELDTSEKLEDPKPTKVNERENKLLKSILEELDDPEFDSPKPNKYFFQATKNQDKENMKNVENTQFKKKFVIESDDEMDENADVTSKKKKGKKRKLENRALQFSDDEEEDSSEPEQDTYESEIEEDNERLVEYDSEENEIEVQVKAPKKARVGRDFFEQEAELTSEDEWIGSGDEDEAGLDRMEREEGDDDTFHQGKLQRELGEIHMREVLDQDKREVRLLQELLFEDGDLGDGHRQRKFRWKNADGDEELGTNVDEYAETQEDEFESEEQWRKQRHEREMFLRKLQEKDGDVANVSINRSTFIKATISSKASSNSTLEKISNTVKITSVENAKLHESMENKTAKVPSPKKPFILLQRNYHNSLLTRGRGALARLAALATPLAGDGDDVPKVNTSSNRRNFVFAAVTPETDSKVTKRKADTAPDTPRLLKKIKQEYNNCTKSSLLDHL